jgi:hypothetical protein
MATRGKKGGSKMIWIIGGLIVIAGGIGAYFLLRKPKEDKTNNDDNNDDDKKPVISSGGENSASQKINAPKELSSKEKIESFQNYVLDVKKDKSILGNAGADGFWGKNSQNAFDKYGSDYLKSLLPVSNNIKTESQLEKDINTIIQRASGNKSQKFYLQKANSVFIQNWAKSIRNNKSAFIWENQIYSTGNGEVVLDFNPIGRTFYTSKSGKIAKTSPSKSSQEWYVNKGVNLGKATDYEYNNGLWIYLPSSGSVYKWYSIFDITKTKPSSSFEGVTEQFEFSAFDNNLDLNI